MDLYALPPEEFTAARDAEAAKDKALKALRKPTVSAWVVNTLVRREAGLLDQLVALGADLSQAQQQGDAAALRELGEQRRQLVGAVTQRAVELVDRDVTVAVRGEVEVTLEAVLADPASAEAVRTGQLVRPLSFAGFGGVDLEGAVADLPARAFTAGGTSATAPSQPKKIQRLEVAALESQGALDDAVRHAERVVRDHGQAEAAVNAEQEAVAVAEKVVEQARRAVAAAEKERDAARARRTRAAKEADEIRHKADRAARAVADAQHASDAARKALDAARRS
jgi:hypothetical protein